MNSYVEPGRRKNGKGSLIALIIVALIFTVAFVLYSSLMYEMMSLALIDEKELGEGLGLALLLVVEITVVGAMIVLYLISLIPFFMSRKREMPDIANAVAMPDKVKSACTGIFIYETILLILSIIAFLVLIFLI